MNILDGLNSPQREAVEHEDGPLLILAGAGSGKTKALTHRIGYLIDQKKVDSSQILAVTFTNKAAREMRERLAHLLGQSDTREFMPWMGTFHSIAVRLLRRDGERIGIARNFVIYDEDDRQGLIKQAMKQLGINDKDIKARTVSSIISNAKNELVDPEQFSLTAQYPFQQTVATIYSKYEMLRTDASALDFDDLLIETVRMFRDHEDIRKKYQNNFRYILVDEYQDTNAAQYHLIKMLVNERRNIAVVGDDWQSIYSWRGADFTNILNFERDFPGAKIIKLEQNYRSTGNILDAAHNVILKNEQRTDKKLWTELGEGSPVQVYQAYDESDEAQKVAERISTHVAMGVRSYNDFAVLYRTNAQSYVLERSFLRFHIPYQIIGGVRFYDRKEIKDIIAYLKLIHQPRDRMSFSRIVNVPTRGIGETSLERFISWQVRTGMDIIEALHIVDEADGLTPRAKSALRGLGSLLYGMREAMIDSSPTDLIEHILRKTGYREYVQDGTPQAADREENIGALISDSKNFVSLEDFLEEVSLMSSADTAGDASSVTMMTLHAAKGLEFPVVCIVGLEEGILPHARVYESNSQADLEEERRLCYVGMTRAREELHMFHAASRLQFGSRMYNNPSRFLHDAGLTTSHSGGYEATRLDDQSDFYNDEPFGYGDRVHSNAFGDGDVVEVDGMAVTVQFDSGQKKKLNAEYARLQKL